ncbi:cGMP-dependent 3',5'-cyclic phosphodiesterase-like [Cyprinus carpio]|uniref:cGMP-dependent 3',5'-cyclic phosphodiesterase-like n=1 Tax=Cyprinus carpio TaxID=7962 RepID=A0A9Q9YWH7_CYPCA|nr:cGMP-dependent 3',5'-cyclic phosphodiesterase-like [Cyprinus carpio]
MTTPNDSACLFLAGVLAGVCVRVPVWRRSPPGCYVRIRPMRLAARGQASVLIIPPVVDRDEGKVISLILAVSSGCNFTPGTGDSPEATILININVNQQFFCDESRKILRLCGELYDLDAASLQLKVINYLQTETQSQCCCLLLWLSEDNHQLFCQVVGDKVLEEEISFSSNLCFGRFGQGGGEKKSITLQDVSQEERGLLSSLLGFEPNSMLCVPVISQATGQVVALACTFNKLGGQRYMEADEHVIQHCFCYTSTVLTSTLAFQKEQKLKFECQALLQVAKNPLHTPSVNDVSVLLQEIIIEARNLSNAEICSVFLLDHFSHELVAKVFDGGVVNDDEVCIKSHAALYTIQIHSKQLHSNNQEYNFLSQLLFSLWSEQKRFTVSRADQAAMARSAWPPKFGKKSSTSKGMHYLPTLCFTAGGRHPLQELSGPMRNITLLPPSKDESRRFLCVCQSLLYKKVHEAQFRSHLANEMMMYHMKVSEEEVTKLLHSGIEPVQKIHPDFSEFTYTPRSLPDDSTPMGILSMLEDMGFINTYKINLHTLARFFVFGEKGLQDPPYPTGAAFPSLLLCTEPHNCPTPR